MTERDPLNAELDELRAEVERLTGLAQIMGEERDRAWTERLIEREELKAEVKRKHALLQERNDEIARLRGENTRLVSENERLRAVTQARSDELRMAGAEVITDLRKELTLALAEVERLKLSRKKVKEAIEDLLYRYGQIASKPVT